MSRRAAGKSDILFGLFFFLLITVSAEAGPDDELVEAQQITMDESLFGVSLAATNDTAVIGSRSDEVVLGGGAAHIYERKESGWELVKTLLPDDLRFLDNFGDARGVAVHGDTVVVSARLQDSQGQDSGSVYVFERDAGGADGWGLVQKLLPPDGAPFDYFGSDLRIDSDTLVVGASGNDAAYVFDRDPFDRNRWLLTTRLTPSMPANNFGASVSLDGDRVVIGAASLGIPPGGGTAWIFERDAGGTDAWGEVVMLETPDGPSEDAFGWSVGLNDRWLAVGAPKSNAGAVYVFERDSDSGEWIFHTRLLAFGVALQFGQEMAIGPDALVVGHSSSVLPVYVYTFRYALSTDTWHPVVKLRREDTGSLGIPLAVTDRDILAGSFAARSVYSFLPERSVSLSVAGICGDEPVVTIRDASPNGSVELLSSGREGASPVPVGPCAGVETSLHNPSLLGSVNVDATGEATFVLDVPDSDCAPLLQVLDTGSCEVSAIEMTDRLSLVRQGKFTAPNANSYGLFGSAVDVQGDTAIIGQPGVFTPGSAWIFEREAGEWSASFELVAPTPDSLAVLGSAVALSGDLAVAGAPGSIYSEVPGYAWVFERQDGSDPWVAMAELTASDGFDADLFGDSVSADGDRIAVGAPIGSAVYLYGRDHGGADAWGEIVRLEAPDGALGDRFGDAVALSGDLLVVGSPQDDDHGSSSGSIYLFEEELAGVWTLKAKLTASDTAFGDEFGMAVAVSADRVAVGAPSAKVEGDRVGKVYVFDREVGTDLWTEVASLRPADDALPLSPFAGPYFGGSIDLQGSLLAVTESKDGAGEAYLFQENSGRWPQMMRIELPGLPAGTAVDAAVAIDGNSVIVGYDHDDDANSNAGAAYPFRWLAPLAVLLAEDGCPGSMTLEARRATPHASLALMLGSFGGPSSISVADCAAVLLDLDEPAFVGFITTDAWGRGKQRVLIAPSRVRKGVPVGRPCNLPSLEPRPLVRAPSLPVRGRLRRLDYGLTVAALGHGSRAADAVGEGSFAEEDGEAE